MLGFAQSIALHLALNPLYPMNALVPASLTVISNYVPADATSGTVFTPREKEKGSC